MGPIILELTPKRVKELKAVLEMYEDGDYLQISTTPFEDAYILLKGSENGRIEHPEIDLNEYRRFGEPPPGGRFIEYPFVRSSRVERPQTRTHSED